MEEELDLLYIVLEERIKLKGTKPGLTGRDGEYKPAFHLQYPGFDPLCGKGLCVLFSFVLFLIYSTYIWREALIISFFGIYQEKN